MLGMLITVEQAEDLMRRQTAAADAAQKAHDAKLKRLTDTCTKLKTAGFHCSFDLRRDAIIFTAEHGKRLAEHLSAQLVTFHS
jgi:hypothetical protein